MEQNFTVGLVCLFCELPLEAEEGKEFHSGDMILCSSCGESNDFDSVLEVAKRKGISKVEEQVASKLKNIFK